MELIAGYTRTGRQLLGSGSDLVELAAKDGNRLTAILFHPEYRGHNAINAALNVVLGFLESPMVSGLAELKHHDVEAAGFVYPTGPVWSTAEVIRTLADMGECAGVRAGVELMYQAGTILVEAAEAGESQGVYSHGGLTPWRVMLDVHGNLQVLGYALPQVEILVFHESPDRIPREDAFRYCPPERMEAKKENFTSDLFGLALVAFELMTGRPVYDGLINDIRTKAARGETSRRIQQFRDQMPPSVQALLTTAMRPEFRDRYQSGADFLDAVSECMADPACQGASLRDVMAKVTRHQPRARQELDPASTAAMSREDLMRMAQEERDEPVKKGVRESVSVPSAATKAAAKVSLPSRPPASAPPTGGASPPTSAPLKASEPPPANAPPTRSALPMGSRPPPSSRPPTGSAPPDSTAPNGTLAHGSPTATPAVAATPLNTPASPPVPARAVPMAGGRGAPPPKVEPAQRELTYSEAEKGEAEARVAPAPRAEPSAPPVLAHPRAPTPESSPPSPAPTGVPMGARRPPRLAGNRTVDETPPPNPVPEPTPAPASSPATPPRSPEIARPAEPAAARGAVPMGAGRLPPSRRPQAEALASPTAGVDRPVTPVITAEQARTPAPETPPPASPAPPTQEPPPSQAESIVNAILRSSSEGGRIARERIEQAMRRSGDTEVTGTDLRSPAVSAPPPPVAAPAPNLPPALPVAAPVANLPPPPPVAAPVANLPPPPPAAAPVANLPPPPPVAAPVANLPPPPPVAAPVANLPPPPPVAAPVANLPPPPPVAAPAPTSQAAPVVVPYPQQAPRTSLPPPPPPPVEIDDDDNDDDTNPGLDIGLVAPRADDRPAPNTPPPSGKFTPPPILPPRASSPASLPPTPMSANRGGSISPAQAIARPDEYPASTPVVSKSAIVGAAASPVSAPAQTPQPTSTPALSPTPTLTPEPTGRTDTPPPSQPVAAPQPSLVATPSAGRPVAPSSAARPSSTPNSPPVTPTPASRTFDPLPSALRPPDAIRSRSRGELVAARLARAPGLRGSRRRLPSETTLAEAAHQLIGQVVPLRTSPDGRVLGWYRIGNDLGPLPVDMNFGELDDEENYAFHFISNETPLLRVSIDGTPPVRLQVATAIPVASLLDALAVQFDLPDGTWQLVLDDVVLDPFHILADHGLTPQSVLVVRRTG